MSKAKMIKFKADDKPLFAKKLDLEETLFEVRKKLENKLPKGILFVCSDGTKIELEDEKDFTLNDIIETENNAYILHLNLREVKEVKKLEEVKETKKVEEVKKVKKVKEKKEAPIPNEKPKKIVKKELIEEEEKEEEEDNGNDEENQNYLQEQEEIEETLDLSEEPSWLKEETKVDDDYEDFHPNFPNKNNKKTNNVKNNKCQDYGSANPVSYPQKGKAKNINKVPNVPNNSKKVLKKPHYDNYDSPAPALNIGIKKREQNIRSINVRNVPKFSVQDLSNFSQIDKKGKLKIYLYPSVEFSSYEEYQALSFMVVGETGCGKTTLLNSFINSLLGVEIDDDFRFKIIDEKFERSQAYSQTSDVTYYNIRSVGGYPPVKIIDTPGYGDTRGIERDREITAQIKQLFYNEISTLNAVCFVTKSSNNRLSHSQRYILSSILDLFGEDVKEIFIFMLTFCDGGKPNIIEPLQEKNCPFSKIIQLYKHDNWYYKFNNSAIFEDNRSDEFTKMFWKLGMKNFSDFKNKLKTLPRKSLTLSKTVLAQRKYLEDKVQILSQKLKVGLNKIEEIKGIMKMVLNLKGDLNDSKNFTKTIKQPAIKKINKDPNYYATTCLTCTKTCHRTCCIKDDDNKKDCAAMDDNGYCTYCPKKCRWDLHKNRDYILEDVMEDKVITLEDLKKRYNYSKSQISVKRQLFMGAREELIKLNIECLETQDKINNSINLLHEIALNKSVFESAEQHIDLLIEVEQSEHKPGWQNRIHGLNVLKAEKRMLRECYNGENKQMNQIRNFVEKEINKYCDIDIDSLENDDHKESKNNCSIF